MKKAFLIIFLTILIVPTAVWAFIFPRMEFVNTENRALVEKPSFTIDEYLTYPEKYEQWLSDYFPFKSQVVKMTNLYQYRLFRRLENPTVQVGGDAWLFYVSSYDSQPIRNYKGLYKISEDDLKTIQNKLEKLYQVFQDNGIKFVVIIAPDKEQIYPEYYPNYYHRLSSLGPGDVIYNYLSTHSTVPILYPKEEFVSIKKDWPTYYRLDSHYNEIGAFISAKQILEQFGIPHCEIEDLSIKEIENRFGDLAHILNLNGYFKEPNAFEISFPFEFTYDYEITETSTEFDRSYFSSSESDRKIVFIGDSFAQSTIPNLLPYYNNINFLHRLTASAELALSRAPDAVVLEVSERYAFDYLLNYGLID